MPITKRDAHYGSPKQLIEYILDEKHDGEKEYFLSFEEYELEYKGAANELWKNMMFLQRKVPNKRTL